MNKNKKNIFITEKQAKQLEEKLLEENSKYPVNPNKVRVVSNYLDDNFTRGGISTFSEDGYPKTICIKMWLINICYIIIHNLLLKGDVSSFKTLDI